MNRKNLTSAVLAGLAGVAGIAATAQAVNLNPDGLGQVLIYPYYTTNGGNQTLISVVNTSEEAKAVKVRFMEGQNTREVLDFNLYMSAWDMWTAALFDNDGTPTLVTDDTSCTVPYIYANENDAGERTGMQEFLPFALDDGGITDISRATEGHFEMLEMGTLVDTDEGSASAATHADGVPDDCQQLVDAWSILSGVPGYWIEDGTNDIEEPSGGLFGGASIIDVGEGTMFSYDAKAINGWNMSGFDVAFNPLHTAPGRVEPSVNSGDTLTASVFLEDGSISMATLSRSVDAVSFVFMHDQVMNEYIVDPTLGAGTEWVMTFPTKQFYVYEPSSGSSDPIAPFTTTWDVSEDGTEGFPCEVVVLDTVWDREEGTIGNPDIPDIPPIVSPAPPDPLIPGIVPFELCYETSVIQFVGAGLPGDCPDGEDVCVSPADGDGHSETPILGSTNFHTIDVDTELFTATAGWARLQLADYPFDEDESGSIDPDEDFTREALGGLEGLPVTGFAVVAYKNAFLGEGADVLANYGGIFQHKATRRVAVDSALPAQ